MNLFYPDTNAWQNAPDQSLTNTNTSLLQRVTSAWSESSITWSNQPTVSMMYIDTLSESTSPNQDYLNIDVATLVQAMVDSGNYGFSLRLMIEQEYARMFFASGDNPDSSARPLLNINYTAPTIVCMSQRLTPSSEDASVDDYFPANNTPNEIEYCTGGWTISGVPVIWNNYFKFDLSMIPSHASIQSAFLSLHYPVVNNFGGIDTSLSHSNISALYRVNSPWNENTITWNNSPTYDNGTMVTIGPSVNTYEDFLNIDVKQLVQDMVNDPVNSYGFLLKMLDESPYARMLFASGDNPDTTKQPMIEVCYSGTIGLNELTDNNLFSIYPNPASDHFTIVGKDGLMFDHFMLYDVCGKLLKQSSVNKQSNISVDVSGLAKGLYFVSIQIEGRSYNRTALVN